MYEPERRLFIGKFSTGLVYADRQREEHGDYMTLAYLNYRTLVLEWRKPKQSVPATLRAEIEADAAGMQAMRGQQYQIAGNMAITLGGVPSLPLAVGMR